jgi:urease accessory protein
MSIDYLLLQVNDALFPIGGYAHSWGFETYVQKGLVSGAASTAYYLRRELSANFLYNELLPARLAYEYALAGKIAELAGLDEILNASRLPAELRDGSRKLASRFAKAVQSFYTGAAETYAATFYPVAYGAFCARAGLAKTDSLAAFIYGQTAARVNTAVKLIPLSQTDGQRLLRECCALFDPLLERLAGLTEDDLCRACPGFDLRAMQHETLYSRLYMS